ncbi:MAG TPA: protein kinase [Chthonomonadales bacterium]|nr:protein kinase [Chthonomonadales bacterium]
MTTVTPLPEHLRAGDVLARSARSTLVIATDERSGEQVAVKTLDTGAWLSAPERRNLSASMARALRPLRYLHHDHLAATRDVVLCGGTCHVVRDYVRGPSVAELVERNGSLDPGMALRLAREVAGALDALARAGLRHGGLTPQNVFVGSGGHASVTDPGFTAESSTFRLAGARCRLQCADAPENDIAWLSALTFHMLTGEWPITSDGSVIRAYHLPSHLRDAIYCGLGADYRRFRTATAFAKALTLGGLRLGRVPALRPAAATGLVGAVAALSVPGIGPVAPDAPDAPTAVFVAPAPDPLAGLDTSDVRALRSAVRRLGPALLANQAAASALGLREEQRLAIDRYLQHQRNQVERVVVAVAEGSGGDTAATMEAIRGSAREHILGILDPDQAARWRALESGANSTRP